MADYLDYLLRHRRLIAYISSDLATLAHPAMAGSREQRARMDAMLAGDDLDFADQVRVAIAFGGIAARSPETPTPTRRNCARRCSPPPARCCTPGDATRSPAAG